MATNLMNNQLKQLKKLGKDVEDLEKKLNKVFDGVDEGKSSSNGTRRNTCLKTSGDIKSTKPLSNDVIRNSRIRMNPKCQRKAKSATLEVTVKTKRHGKSSRSHASPDSGRKKDSRGRNEPFGDAVPNEEVQPCRCRLNSKNMVWSNILKHSELPNSPVPNLSEERITSCKADCDDHAKGYCCGNNCRSKRLHLQPHKTTLQPSVQDAGTEVAENDLICNDLLNTGKCSMEVPKDQNLSIPQFCNPEQLKPQPKRNDVDELCPITDSSLKPIDSLCILMEELRRTTACQPTQTLVQDMETALKRLCKAAETSSEAYVNCKSSSKNGELVDGAALKINKEPEDRMGISLNKPCIVSNAMVQVPYNCQTDDNSVLMNSGRTKDDKLAFQNNQGKFAVAEKFELLVKVNDDSGAKRQYVLGNDEKLKAEIEYLNKQLNLQLKSVEGLSTKESEYHKLITSLIEKVDKLETQVNEQTKATQHFYSQCNSLLDQNSVIPKMQKKNDLLNKQLLDTIHNYEKLKIEYCLVKLEKEKYFSLNCEKEKEIRRFRKELIKIQTLVSQQKQKVQRYLGYSSAAEKVDALLGVIDSQSNIIKSKLRNVSDLDELNISSMESPSPSSSSPPSRRISPFSYSVRLNSPEKTCKSPSDVDGQERNLGYDSH